MNHVFVCGCDRSGTTLVANLLAAAEPAATVLPEAQFVVDHLLATGGAWDAGRFVADLEAADSFRSWNRPLDATTRGALAAAGGMDTALTALAGGAEIVIDQTPWSIGHVELLRRHVPGAGFVNVVRDGRAVHASWRGMPWGPNTPAATAQLWQVRIAQGLVAGRSGARVASVRFEDVLANPRPRIAAVWADLGRPVQVPEGFPAEHGGFVGAQASAQYHQRLNQGLDPARATAWRDELPSRDVETFEFWAGDVLAHLGYELVFGGYATRPPGAVRVTEAVKEFGRFYGLNPARRVWDGRRNRARGER